MASWTEKAVPHPPPVLQSELLSSVFCHLVLQNASGRTCVHLSPQTVGNLYFYNTVTQQ